MSCTILTIYICINHSVIWCHLFGKGIVILIYIIISIYYLSFNISIISLLHQTSAVVVKSDIKPSFFTETVWFLYDILTLKLIHIHYVGKTPVIRCMWKNIIMKIYLFIFLLKIFQNHLHNFVKNHPSNVKNQNETLVTS